MASFQACPYEIVEMILESSILLGHPNHLQSSGAAQGANRASLAENTEQPQGNNDGTSSVTSLSSLRHQTNAGLSQPTFLPEATILGYRDLRALTLVSQHFYNISNPTLYQWSKERHGSDAVIRASKIGSVSGLDRALYFGLNICNPAGGSPLHTAAQANQPSAIGWLIDHGAEIDAKSRPGVYTFHRNSDKITALQTALESRSASAAIALLSRGASVTYDDPRNRWSRCRISSNAPLHKPAVLDAVWYGLKDVLVYLVMNGGLDVNNPALHSLLPIAASAGEVDVVKWLLDGGLDVDARDNGRPWMSALGCALWGTKNREDVATLLISRGASLEWRQSESENRPKEYAIIDAIAAGLDVVVEYLVNETEAGAAWNDHEIAGGGAYIEASFNKIHMFQTLLNLGLDVNGPGPAWENSHLKHALSRGHWAHVHMLLDRGARIDGNYVPANSTTPWTPTPILDLFPAEDTYYLVEPIQRTHVLRRLIAMGADVNQVVGGRDYTTPLEAALSTGLNSLEDAILLIEVGARVYREYPDCIQENITDLNLLEEHEHHHPALAKLLKLMIVHIARSDDEHLFSHISRECSRWALDCHPFKDILAADAGTVKKHGWLTLVSWIRLLGAILQIMTTEEQIELQHIAQAFDLGTCLEGHSQCWDLVVFFEEWMERLEEDEEW